MRKNERLLVGIAISLFLLLTMLTLTSNSAVAGASTNTLIKRALISGSYNSASFIASKADLYVCHYDSGWIVPQIHSLRPDLVVLLYRNLRAISENSPEWQLALNNNWILKDANGNFLYDVKIPSLFLVDKGNPSYQEWAAQWLKRYIDQYGFDGVYEDCSGYPWIGENCFDSNWWAGWAGVPVNPLTGNGYTDQEWRNAEISLANKIKSYIDSKLLIQNGVFCGSFFFKRPYSDILLQSRVDGTVSEGWMLDLNQAQWYTESQWQDAINFELWMGNNLFPQKSAGTFMAVCQNAAPLDESAAFLPAGCTNSQYALFVYGSLLLGVTTTGDIYLNLGLYSDTYYVQNLHAIDVGLPTNDYYVISGTHVYTRDFTNAKVIVNPTNISYTAILGGTYQSTDGTSIGSSITVYPHTAVILKPTYATSVTTLTTTSAGSRLTVLSSNGGSMWPPIGTHTEAQIGGFPVWLIAHPAAGYTFSHFLIDGQPFNAQYYESDGDFTFYLQMDRDHTVQPIFKSTQYSSSNQAGAIFQSGFETGDFSDWASTYTTGGTTATVYPFPYDGAYSGRFAASGGYQTSRSYAYYKSLTGMSSATISMSVYAADDLSFGAWNALWLVQFIGGTGTVLASYGVKSNGWTTNWDTYSNGVDSFATSGLNQGRWYKVDAYFTRATSGETVVLYVDGVKVSSLSLDTSASGIAAVRCGIGYYDGGSSIRIYVDDVSIKNY
jgi:hypothetical protein